VVVLYISQKIKFMDCSLPCYQSQVHLIIKIKLSNIKIPLNDNKLRRSISWRRQPQACKSLVNKSKGKTQMKLKWIKQNFTRIQTQSVIIS
jgi:hypothetical protein